MNSNFGKIDKFLGFILVNDGVTPPDPDLFDGCLVKERTSGKVWEARKNTLGAFSKVWVEYPYHFRASSDGVNAANGGDVNNPLQAANFNAGQAVNSSAADIDTGSWKAPIRGIYLIDIHTGFASNATGLRVLKWRVNGTVPTTDDFVEISMDGNAAGSNTRMNYVMTRLCQAGEMIMPVVYQTSGGVLATRSYIDIALISPVQEAIP